MVTRRVNEGIVSVSVQKKENDPAGCDPDDQSLGPQGGVVTVKAVLFMPPSLTVWITISASRHMPHHISFT
jgi:hypothetical protein